MKKIIISICTFFTALSFVSCGNTSRMDSLIENNDKQVNVTEKSVTKAVPDPSLTGTFIIPSAADTGSSEYDIDLTVLDGTMLYAKVLEMVNNPEDYNGKTVRATGPFS